MRIWDVETGKEQSITVTATSGLTADEINEMMTDASDFAITRREDEAAEKVRQEAETLIAEIERLFPEVESIVAGVKLKAHPLFRIVATMNDDELRQYMILHGYDSNSFSTRMTSLRPALPLREGLDLPADAGLLSGRDRDVYGQVCGGCFRIQSCF